MVAKKQLESVFGKTEELQQLKSEPMIYEIKDPIGFIFDSIQLSVVLIGALWAYFRFRKENPLHPRIEFNLECDFLGPQSGSYLTSFMVSANNKGNVEHKFSEIRLRVLGIKKNKPFTEFPKYAPMVEFPEVIFKGINMVPEKFGYFFVRPNVNQTFNYTTQIHDDIQFIIVRATFKYYGTDEIHMSEKVFEVKST